MRNEIDNSIEDNVGSRIANRLGNRSSNRLDDRLRRVAGINRKRSAAVLSVAVILLFASFGPGLFRPLTEASPPGMASLATTGSSTNASTLRGDQFPPTVPVPSAAMPMSTTIATPTPVPNRYIWIPWRSQFDGSPYAASNCGPACLGMAMSYYGEWWSTGSIRQSTNERSGVTGFDEGTDWPSLQYGAETRGFTVVGLYDSSGAYRKWTIDDLVKETDQGHPVLLLVHFRSLPDHVNSSYNGDHYIVFLGLMADGRVVYHDPAYSAEVDGAYRIIGQETLLEAWANTSVGQQCTAMSIVWDHDARKWDDTTVAQPTRTDAQ